MSGRARSFTVFVLVAVALVAAWELVPPLLFPSTSVHYKLSVDVDDNGVLRHGEGVIGVAFQSQGPLLIGTNMPQWSTGTIGEAFAIDIGERGSLYVLLVGDVPRNKRYHIKWNQEGYSPDAGYQALWDYFDFAVNDFPNGLESKAKIDAFAASKTSVELVPGSLPLLVRFRDPNDPSSVEVVDPDNLGLSFGVGVKLAHARADITNEPLTSGIKQRLGWLALGYREKYLFTLPSAPGSKQAAPQDITYGDFWSSTK